MQGVSLAPATPQESATLTSIPNSLSEDNVAATTAASAKTSSSDGVCMQYLVPQVSAVHSLPCFLADPNQLCMTNFLT